MDNHELKMRLLRLEAIVQRHAELYNELATDFNAHTHTYNPSAAGTSLATSVTSVTAPATANTTFTLNRLP
jgi:hypothetical protein